MTLSDKEIQGSGITYGRKTAQAIANSLAAGANAYVFGQLSASGITLSASVNLSSKQNIAQLYATAENNGLDVGSTVVVLTPTEYSKILAELSYDVLGSDRAVADGRVDHAFGFKSIICTGYIPSALSAKGYLIQDCALGVVSRYLPPADEGATEAWKVESDYGLTISMRRVYDAIRGRSSLAGTLLMGCQVAVPSRIVKLV